MPEILGQPKIDQNRTLLETTSAVSLAVDVTNIKDAFIVVHYGVNAGGNIKLQASDENVSASFADIATATTAADVAGGSVQWNVTGLMSKYVRIIVPASAATRVVMQG